MENKHGSRFNQNKPKLSLPKAKKPKGHEAKLQKILDEGGKIEIVYSEGVFSGKCKLLDFDKYTISVDCDGGELILFKHAIAGFKRAANE